MVLTIKHSDCYKLIDRLEKAKKQFKENDWDLDFTVLKTYFKEVKHGTDFNLESGYKWNTYRVMVDDVEITGCIENPSWRVVGIAERQKNGEVTISTIDKKESIPADFYGSQIRCDHCHTNRRRDQGVIIYNKDEGTFKMVGTACLKDYTGLSFEALNSLFGLKEETTDGSGRLVSTHYTIDKYQFNVEELLCTAYAMIIERREKLSKYMMGSGINYSLLNYVPTILFAIHCPTGNKGVNKTTVNKGLSYRTKYISIHNPMEYVEQIKSMRDWIENLNEDITYEGYKPVDFETKSNLKTLAHQDYVNDKGAIKLVELAGLYVYNVVDKPARDEESRQAEIRRLERLAEEKRLEEERKAIEAMTPIRNVNDHVEVDIKSKKVSDVRYSDYGSYVVLDIEGTDYNKYYCYLSAKRVKDCETITKIKGTVKCLNTYKGVKKYQLAKFELC